MVQYTINFYHLSITLDFIITALGFFLAAILDQSYFILISRQYMFILLFLLLFISYITNDDKRSSMSKSIRTFQNIQISILPYPFMTTHGRKRTTFFAMPASATTSTTSSISLYANEASSSKPFIEPA